MQIGDREILDDKETSFVFSVLFFYAERASQADHSTLPPSTVILSVPNQRQFSSLRSSQEEKAPTEANFFALVRRVVSSLLAKDIGKGKPLVIPPKVITSMKGLCPLNSIAHRVVEQCFRKAIGRKQKTAEYLLHRGNAPQPKRTRTVVLCTLPFEEIRMSL